ncbi:PLP-dependent transferase [Atractiella rhizophila]|nr:PLP-dependent transferase [Atractiella rhizophila]
MKSAEHDKNWVLSPHPPSSEISSTATPNFSFDTTPDFIPDPSNAHSLRHCEYGWEGFAANGENMGMEVAEKEREMFKTTSMHWSHPENKQKRIKKTHDGEEEEDPGYFILLTTYYSYVILILLGHLRDFLGKKFYRKSYKHLMPSDGYAPLTSDWDSFYTRRLKARIDMYFARPVTAVPGRTITLLSRVHWPSLPSFRNRTFSGILKIGGNGGDGRVEWRYPVKVVQTTNEEEPVLQGETLQALNTASYNYLGFAQSRGWCADWAQSTLLGDDSLCKQQKQVDGSEEAEVMPAFIPKVPVHAGYSGAPQNQVGTHLVHVYCDRLVARFVGMEDAMVVSQGYATNSTNLPALIGKGDLILSDEHNHNSIRFGARLSNAMIRQYKHNDIHSLEKVLREAISQGQPAPRGKTNRIWRPWKRIFLLVEGLYSMEGTIVDLPGILKLKKKYKFYLYIDEAHSIGALGPRRRGVCDYFGIDPKEVDVLMGTLTKSFGAAGGYIAGSHEMIKSMRNLSHSNHYAEPPSPAVTAQIVASMAAIMGPEAAEVIPSLPRSLIHSTEGQYRLERLSFNCRYLSGGLRRLGFIVFGSRDSPIIPLLIYHPGKFGLFVKQLLERHRICSVIAAYPATPLPSGRIRFCISSAHTKHDIDRILIACDDVGTMLGLKFSPKRTRKNRWTIQQVMERWREVIEDFEDD